MGFLNHKSSLSKGSVRSRKLQRNPASRGGSPASPAQPANPTWEPKKPIWQRFKGILYLVAAADERHRENFFETSLTLHEKLITEQLEKLVCQEMESRSVLVARAFAKGKTPDQTELTPLQKKAAEAAHILDAVALPPPFSATPRNFSDPSAVPAAAGTPLINEDGEAFQGDNSEILNELHHYVKYYESALITERRLTRMSGKVIGTLRAGCKNILAKADDKDEQINQNYRDIVADFIAQEKFVFARRKNPGLATSTSGIGVNWSRSPKVSIQTSTTVSLLEGIAHLSRSNAAQRTRRSSTASPLRGTDYLSLNNHLQVVASSATRSLGSNDDSLEWSMSDPANHTLVNDAAIEGAPLIRINSNDTIIKRSIFDGKDGALTPEQLVDFKSSVSAPDGLAGRVNVDVQPRVIEGSKSMAAFPSPRPAPPVLADDDETPKRLNTGVLGGMKRVDTMNDFHAMRNASSMSDMYSNADDITSPVPFSTTIYAGDNARNRRLGRAQLEDDGQKSSPRHSVMELSEQAIVAKRLADATKTGDEKPMTPEERKQLKKAQIQSKLDYDEGLNGLASMNADRQRQLLEKIDREDCSSPRDDDSSPIAIGQQGSQLFLRRDKLTTFSELSFFSDDGVPTPKHDQSLSNLFASPVRKSSPLAQPPMNAGGSLGMSNMNRNHSAGPSSSANHLYGFPLPPSSGNKLQEKQHLTVPNMVHPSSDDNLPSSPSNKFGSVGARGKWKGKGAVKERAENLFSDDAEPQVNKRLSRIPRPIDPSSPLMTKFQGLNTPSASTPRPELSPNEFAPGTIRKESGVLNVGRVQGRKRSASVENKLKQLYVDQTDGRGVYSTPAISSGGDMAPPAPVAFRADAFEVNRSPSAQKMFAKTLEMNELNRAMMAKSTIEKVDLNKAMTVGGNVDDSAGMRGNNGADSADEESETYYSAKSSPLYPDSEYASGSPPAQIPETFRSASGNVLSMARSFELRGSQSLTGLSSQSSPRPFLSPIPSTTPVGTPTRRTLLTAPTSRPLGSSPLRRATSFQESPEQVVQRIASGRSFLPQSRTIPQSLVAQVTITRAGAGPINRSPERVPYMDRSGASMYRLNSTMRLPEAGDEDPDSFVKNAAKAVKWAENGGKRFSRGF